MNSPHSSSPRSSPSPAAARNGNVPSPAPSVVDGLLLARALGFAVGVVMLGYSIAWLTGLIPSEHSVFAGFGVVGALGAAIVAVWLHGRFLRGGTARRLAGDGPLLAGHLQGLLAAAFAVKLAVLVVAFLLLRQQGVKFSELATFAITFAAASLLCQLASAGYLARAIQPRLGPPVASAGPSDRSPPPIRS